MVSGIQMIGERKSALADACKGIKLFRGYNPVAPANVFKDDLHVMSLTRLSVGLSSSVKASIKIIMQKIMLFLHAVGHALIYNLPVVFLLLFRTGRSLHSRLPFLGFFGINHQMSFREFADRSDADSRSLFVFHRSLLQEQPGHLGPVLGPPHDGAGHVKLVPPLVQLGVGAVDLLDIEQGADLLVSVLVKPDEVRDAKTELSRFALDVQLWLPVDPEKGGLGEFKVFLFGQRFLNQ